MDDKEEKDTPNKGKDLLNQVIHLSGIPAKSIKSELETIFEKKNVDLNHLTLDQLREVVASYVREIMSAALDKTSPKKPEN